MRYILLVILLLLPGCGQLASVIPSMQHCQEVTYHRQGNAIDLSAKCTAPVGGGLV